MDLLEKRAKLDQLALGIDRYLPDGWSLFIPKEEDTISDRAFFVKGDLKFGISLNWDKPDRLDISTWTWPSYTTRIERDGIRRETIYPNNLYDPKEISPAISVSATKGYDVIAKDIARRFLPEYERIYARCKEKASNYQAHADNSRAQWERVCKWMDKSPTHGIWYSGVGPLTVANRSGSLHVEGYVSESQLRRIAFVLSQPDPEDVE